MGVVMLYVIGIVGGVIMLVGLTTLLGICCKSACLLVVMQMFWIVLLLAQIALAVFLFYWVQALDDVSADTLSNLQGVGDGVHEGKLGADALKEAEGFMCRSYQRCCRDPALDAPAHAETGSGEVNMAAAGNRTCLASHAGTSSDVAAAFDDPSTPSFCEYISGSSETVALKPNTRTWSTPLPLETCRANFCLLGAEGYFEFVQCSSRSRASMRRGSAPASPSGALPDHPDGEPAESAQALRAREEGEDAGGAAGRLRLPARRSSTRCRRRVGGRRSGMRAGGRQNLRDVLPSKIHWILSRAPANPQSAAPRQYAVSAHTAYWYCWTQPGGR